ncbi:uncharacterized protein N7518_005626 [Penicillium psychrosexuale]|uniref:uncharacterized protein n=1 Tax=Penicillium psychrosexuale TaxID=1002107 RepID=UPI002545008E|nr:uncharacterized protein N7518_005626 [Penicillium psychrosexuale]KAJ5797086.1 hypothetical protein N7518_005626 [Penicillium psychrosexuale]
MIGQTQIPTLLIPQRLSFTFDQTKNKTSQHNARSIKSNLTSTTQHISGEIAISTARIRNVS